jgi:Na+/phosphate symporter
MDEKEMTYKFYEVFDAVMPILDSVKKGFFSQKETVIKEGKTKFRDIIKSRVGFVEGIIEKEDKDALEKKYLSLLPAFQTIGLAIENLINKMETKIELHILFSERALTEVKELFNLMLTEMRDTRDFLLTGNPHLKENIKTGMEKICKEADEYALVHQNRLITGVCMPKASYLYLDIIDSFERIAKGLFEFSAKV